MNQFGNPLLEQCIDKWGRSAAAQEDQRAHPQEDDEDRQEPPFLVVLQKIPELGDEVAAPRSGELAQVTSFCLPCFHHTECLPFEVPLVYQNCLR